MRTVRRALRWAPDDTMTTPTLISQEIDRSARTLWQSVHHPLKERAPITSEALPENPTSVLWRGADPRCYGTTMIAPRSNDGSRRRAMSPRTRKSKPQWVRVPNPGRIPAATNSARKRIFAIVSRPIPTAIEGKTIRHVVIFDNHPDSIRLVLQARLDETADDFAVRRDKLIPFVCGAVLIAMSVAALLWAFLS
jgi:hypothetical protein